MITVRTALVTLALSAAVASAQQTGQASRPLAIMNVGVIDPSAGAVTPGLTVVIQDGRIVSVGKDPAPRGAELVDGRGKRADLVLLDANPLEDIRHIRRIRAVVARGKLLDRPNLDRLLREAVSIADKN